MDYVKLKDICEIGTGSSNAREAVEDGIYPFYIRSKELKRINKYEYDEKAIIIPGEGGIGDIFHYVEGKYSLHQRAYRIAVKDEKIYPKFVYYYLKNFFKAWIISKAVSGTVISIRKPMIEEFKIPVINLDMQQKIANILDNYTKANDELIDNLNKKYSLRCKQYEYYRDEILSFGDDVTRVKLKEIATSFFRGNGIKKDEFKNVGLPCIRYGEIYTKYGISFKKCYSYINEDIAKNKKYIEFGDVLFAITGESVKDIGKSTVYLGNEKVYVGGDILVMKHNQNPRYISYALSTSDAVDQKIKRKIKSKVVHTNLDSISNIEIPLPKLEKQREIVSILDKYEIVYNEVREKILTEISLREKQYKYYIDKIFNFK